MARANLFHRSDNLKLGGGLEEEALSSEEQLQVAGHISAGDVGPHDGVREGKPLVDWHRMSHAVARIQHHARRPTSGIAGEPSASLS